MLIDSRIDAHDLLKQLALKNTQQCDYLLEIGAGSGDLLRQLSQIYQAKACGIDPFMSNYTDGLVTFRGLRAEDIERLEKRYDLVYTVHSFHHFSDVNSFFEGLEKILSWDGKFILVDWKQGTYTGVPEKYYALEDVVTWMQRFNFKIIEQGTTPEHFYIVAVLKNKKLAVATKDGITIFPKMFGQSPFFDIYCFQYGDGFRFLERRENIYQNTMQHLKTLDVYSEVADCQALLSAHIGRKGIQRIKERGVKLFFEKGDVQAALSKIN